MIVTMIFERRLLSPKCCQNFRDSHLLSGVCLFTSHLIFQKNNNSLDPVKTGSSFHSKTNAQNWPVANCASRTSKHAQRFVGLACLAGWLVATSWVSRKNTSSQRPSAPFSGKNIRKSSFRMNATIAHVD